MSIEFNKKKVFAGLKEANHWLKKSDKVLSSLYHARGGTLPERVLAVGTVVSSLIETIIEESSEQTDLDSVLEEEGYRRISDSNWYFIIDVLIAKYTPKFVKSFKQFPNGKFLKITDDIFFFAWSAEEFQGPFTPEKLSDKDFYQKVYEAFWAGSNSILLSYKKDSHYKASNVKVFDLPVGKDYVGSPTAEDIVKRLKMFKGNRTVMFLGPSGSGKGTLARQVCNQLDENAKLLKLSFEGWDAYNKAVTTTRLTKPTILLIDDIQDVTFGKDLLEFFEILHDEVPNIIVTWMTKDKKKKDNGEYTIQIPNLLRQEGFRPGRIDEVIVVDYPDAIKRRDIFKHYLGFDAPEELIEMSNGLTGAYIMDISERIKLFGIDNWKEEVSRILSIFRGPEDDDDEIDEDSL